MSRIALSVAISLLVSSPALAQGRAVSIPVEIVVLPGVSGANANAGPALSLGSVSAPLSAPSSLAPLLGLGPSALVPATRVPSLLAGQVGYQRRSLAEAGRGAAVFLSRRAPAAATPRGAAAAAVRDVPAATGVLASGTPGRANTADASRTRDRSAADLLPVLSARPELATRGFDGSRFGGAALLPEEALSEEALSGKLPRPLPRGTGAAESPQEDAPKADVQSPQVAAPSAPESSSGWLRRLGDHPVVVAFLWNFATVGAAYIINPLRGAFLLTKFEPTVMPFVYMGSAAATALAVWLYGRFAKTGRAKLVGGTILVLTASLAGWWALGPVLAAKPALAFAFYMFGDVFSILSVTVFWSYMNDVFRGERAKHYFGRLASAGSLGAIVTSIAVNLNVKGAGAIPLILAAAALYVLTFGLMLYMERWAAREGAAGASAAEAAQDAQKAGGESAGKQAPEPKAGIWKTLFSSKIALLLTLLVLLERLVPDFANYVFAFEMKAAYPVMEDFVRAQARFAAWQNGLSFVAGMALAGWLIRKAGLTWGLATAAIANLIGMAAYVVSPGLSTALTLNGVEGGIRYTFFKAAKEQTWSNVPKDVLFQLKAFVEAFVYRFGRGISGALLLVLTGSMFLGLSAVPAAMFQLPLAAAWLLIAWKLGRQIQAKRG